MSKEFIPYEETSSLIALGFKEPVIAHRKDGLNICLLEHPEVLLTDLSMILYQQAFRWFREVHGLDGHVTFRHSDTNKVEGINSVYYDIEIYRLTGGDAYKSYRAQEISDDKESAELACLRKLIDLVNQNKDDANRKRTKVHRLPTEDKSQIWGWRLGLAFMKTPSKPVKGAEGLPYHLYFTTDEEIKEGDWYLATIFGHGTEETKPLQWSVGTKPCGEQPMGRKIIATTDPKLELYTPCIMSLQGEPFSQPSQDFIKAYCEQGGIDEVDVEYEYHKVWDKRTEELLEKYFTLKLDLRGLITIHHIV